MRRKEVSRGKPGRRFSSAHFLAVHLLVHSPEALQDLDNTGALLPDSVQQANKD
jgi:hypothetical protein